MPPLPVVSGRDLVKVFESQGWSVARQKGSHIIMVRDGSIVSLSVPDHDEVAKGTLRSLLRNAGIGTEDFVKICRDIL